MWVAPPVLAVIAALAIMCPRPLPAAGISGNAEYLVHVFDTARGLSNDTVTAFAQTPDGYIWAATNDGLVRFDGAQFQVTNTANTPGFPGDFILGLFVDRRGWLWAGTDHGVACLRNRQWRVFRLAEGISGYVERFFEDSDGNLLAATGSGVFLFSDERFVLLPTPPAKVRSYTADTAGALWSGGPAYLARYQSGHWNPVALPDGAGSPLLKDIARARDGGIWTASASGVRKLHNGEWGPFIPLPENLRFGGVTMLEDSEGNLWAGDIRDGVVQFHKDGRVLRFGTAEGLSHPQIRALFEDREGDIWVGSVGGGMARIKPRVVVTYGEAEGLRESIVDAVAEESPGVMLVGTYGAGLVRFDRAASRFGAPFGLPANASVLDILRGPSDILAVAYDQGIFRIRQSLGELLTPCTYDHEWTGGLFRDSSGALWFGTEKGLASCREGVFTRHGPESGLPAGSVSVIVEDSQGRLLVGGAVGLFRKQGNRFERVAAKGLGDGRIVSILPDRDGTLWIGPKGRGLYRLRGEDAVAVWPPPEVPALTVSSIIEDDAHRLWLATSTQGLISIARAELDAAAAGNRRRARFAWFRRGDGLETNNFRSDCGPAACKASDGTLWFATMKGVAVVNPARLRDHSWVPPVWIESVSIDGLPASSAASASAISIPAGGRRIMVRYTGIGFRNPEQMRFQYRLDGADKDWQDTTERAAVFSNLPPGDYVFRVRAGNSDGLWNEAGAVQPIHVLAFFWQTLWFQFTLVIALMTCAGALVQSKHRRKMAGQTAQLEKERALRVDLERMQNVLRVSEERFFKAFNASPFPVAIVGRDDGRFADANQAFLRSTEYSRDQVIGRLASDLNLWAGQDERIRLGLMLLRENEVRDFAATLRSRTGQLSHHLISVEPIELEGRPCLLIASNDVTERRRLEGELLQSQKMESVGRLAGGVAHDFNNLLTVINGYAELILADAAHDPQLEDRVQQIHHAGQRAADLTKQLLSFSRRQVMKRQAINLNTQVSAAQKMLVRLLGANIEVITHPDPALSPVMADAGQIDQVLLNLAVNARDAMPNGGKLIIETANVTLTPQYAAAHAEVNPGPCVLLSVTDTGMGMDEEVRRRIFEPFFTTKMVGQGTGLGLATVYGIVRQSGGWIWVYSEVGRGATFKIYLPSVGPILSPEDQSPSARHSPGPPRGWETILLVEDQPDVRRLAREVLQSHGYRVLEAGDGAAALQAAGSYGEPVHLLLTDVVMPNITGFELAERLAEIHPETRVLYMSGYSENVLRHQGVPDRPFDCLQKPLSPQALAAKVREVLGPPGAATHA